MATDKPKRKLSEKQKEVLAKNNFKNKTPAERSELGARGAAKTNQIKQEKIKRENGSNIVWDEFLGTKEQLKELWDSLSPKDKKDVLLRLLPNEVQKHEFKDVTPEIKVATQEDLKALEKLKNADFNKGIS